MPRPPRLHVTGGCYHVILRGNHREALFASPADRAALNEIVASVIERFDARVHAFCWMTNHLHALLQIAERPLGKIMQCISMRYLRCRHKALRTTGHLFERRYRARLIDVDEYFATVLRYIHLNPVKARIVSDPAEYPWSSHRAYLARESIPWLTTHFGLSLFASDSVQAREAYSRFILQPDDARDGRLELESHPEDPRILGTDQFIARIPAPRYRPRTTLTLEQLAQAVCARYNVGIELVRSRSARRILTPIRLEIAREAMEQRVATMTDVAEFLNRDSSTLCKLFARHQRKFQ